MGEAEKYEPAARFERLIGLISNAPWGLGFGGSEQAVALPALDLHPTRGVRAARN